jgi:hypothetical protein
MSTPDVRSAGSALLLPNEDNSCAEEKNRAAFLQTATLILIMVPSIVSLGLASIGQGFRAATAIPFAVVGYAVWRLLRQGRTQPGFLTLLYGTWLCSALSVMVINGVRGPACAIFAIILVFATWFAGRRTAIVLTVATILVLIAAAYGEWTGWPIPVSVDATPFYNAMILSCIAVAAGLLGYYAAETLRAQLHALRSMRTHLEDYMARSWLRDQELMRREVAPAEPVSDGAAHPDAGQADGPHD